MLVLHPSLVGSHEPSLQQGCDPVDSWKQILVCFPWFSVPTLKNSFVLISRQTRVSRLSAGGENVPGMGGLKCTTLHNGKRLDSRGFTPGEFNDGQSCKNGRNTRNSTTSQKRMDPAEHLPRAEGSPPHRSAVCRGTPCRGVKRYQSAPRRFERGGAKVYQTRPSGSDGSAQQLSALA